MSSLNAESSASPLLYANLSIRHIVERRESSEEVCRPEHVLVVCIGLLELLGKGLDGMTEDFRDNELGRRRCVWR